MLKIKEIYSASDIGEEFDAHQKSLIISCLQGGVKGINKLIVVTAQDTPKGVAALINQDFNYLVTPYIDGESCSEIITTVEQLREEGKNVFLEIEVEGAKQVLSQSRTDHFHPHLRSGRCPHRPDADNPAHHLLPAD